MGAPPPKEHQFKPGRSGNPSGKPTVAPDLERAAKLLTAEQRAELGIEGDGPLTPQQLRAIWWAKVIPIVIAGPKSTTDTVFRYAHQEVGNRLMGKPKEIVEFVDPRVEMPIDWSKVPIADRKRLLAAMDEIEQLTGASDDDDEAP